VFVTIADIESIATAINLFFISVSSHWPQVGMGK
jgi:hypothetical protein